MIDKTYLRPALLFAVTVIVDQVTKLVALATLQPGTSVPVLGDLLRWTLTYNPGGVFGMRLAQPVFYLFSSIAIFVVLAFYVIANRRTLYIALPLSIVAGGAIGNIIDRLRFGQVVDFIDCDFPDIDLGFYSIERWPIFNVADMAVSCGIITTIILMYYHSLKAKRAQVDALILPPSENLPQNNH